jgi:hypothetical protein
VSDPTNIVAAVGSVVVVVSATVVVVTVDDGATVSATGVVVVATDVAGAGGASVAVTGAAVMVVDDSGVDVTITAAGASDDPQALITIATAALARNRRPPTPPASHLARPNNDITPGSLSGNLAVHPDGRATRHEILSPDPIHRRGRHAHTAM